MFLPSINTPHTQALELRVTITATPGAGAMLLGGKGEGAIPSNVLRDKWGQSRFVSE